MAQYSSQRTRQFPSPPGPAGRDVGEDYSFIFGQERPPASSRTQTMGSRPAVVPQDRAQTMGANTAAAMQRVPPARPNQQYPRESQVPNGYQIPNGMAPPPSLGQRAPSMPHTYQNNYNPSGPLPNRQPQPPPRVEPRPSYPQTPTPKPVPNRGYPPTAGPALNNDGFRSQSLASAARPPPFRTGPSYNAAPANAFRQQPYKSHTTAQGRAIPERHDERTMSMSSFARDSEFTQTPSGRVIPTRRRESNGHDARPSVDTTSTQRTFTNDGRSMSMASTTTMTPDRSYSLMSMSARPSMTNASANNRPRRRSPLVYPALLSRVATAFRERINLTDKEKDGLVYKSSFTGAEAVDLIAYIMQTTDRNLALLLGRSLDAQKFFHDVTYDHRLRDSESELYQFRETIVEDGNEVNGVFTLTTECYSPTCTPERLCYSIACPKRIDQQKRMNKTQIGGLQKSTSRESLHDDQGDEQKLWINTVSKEIADSIDDREKKRQEIISELCYTERDFVKDLEYLQDFWINPLRKVVPGKPPTLPEPKREKFIHTVFCNTPEVYAVNLRLAEALTRRQQQHPVVRNVGDILLEFVPRFPPFIRYGANQLWGKYDFEREKKENPFFKKFTDETERLKESRKLELNGYLTKPTTRLARYPLLLDSILKYTADDNPDKRDLPAAISGIREVLSKVNQATGREENKFNLMQLDAQLFFKPGERNDMKLREEGRRLIFKGPLKKTPTDNNAEILTYLFDNYLLFVRPKTTNKKEELRVYKKPIPLALLVINQMEEVIPRLGLAKRPSSSLIPGNRNREPINVPKQDAKQQQGHPLTFRNLGRGAFELTLYATSPSNREKWIKLVNDQQDTMRDHKNLFTKTIVNEGFFNNATRITCGVPIDGGRKLVVGTDTGVWLVDRRSGASKPRRVLDVRSVSQVDVLEQHSILLVLYEKTLYSFSTSVLEPDDNALASRRGRKISGCNFFKIGVFEGQHLVCCVKTSALSATVKVYKPMETMSSQKKKSGFSNLFAGGNQDVLKPFKEFYVPTETYSVHFLRSSLCVGCARGFEIVTLDTLVTQPLLDQADTSLDFVALKENLKPIHVERLNQAFLLCYTDFAFFVNKHGWRTFNDWKITWEGAPHSFAIHQPYILAFEPNFIEIRNMDDGELVYILTAKSVRMLHSSNREILYAYEDEFGEDVVASLDFWSHGQSGPNLHAGANGSHGR
ncbi:MAG: hypothetical protein Q9162_007241 [Coniocarpon cinnabarinum]